jgi:hypothetical protein
VLWENRLSENISENMLGKYVGNMSENMLGICWKICRKMSGNISEKICHGKITRCGKIIYCGKTTCPSLPSIAGPGIMESAGWQDWEMSMD